MCNQVAILSAYINGVSAVKSFCVNRVITPNHGKVSREMSSLPGHGLGPIPEAMRRGLTVIIFGVH